MVSISCRTLFLRPLFSAVRCFSTEGSSKDGENAVLRRIQSRIKMSGPISVADYMKEVLVNPKSGYYMKKDVFGTKGDFITSPEISQLFGEMIGIWCVNELKKIGEPTPFQLIELGPGRGTMMEDILRVVNKFKLKDCSVHMVEVSPELSKIQAKRLCKSFEEIANKPYYMKGITHNDIPVQWYTMFDDIPKRYSCIFAHEFFDALPIHKFQRTEKGWREVLIDTDRSGELRFVVSPNATPASAILVPPNEKRHHFELSPHAGALMERLAARLEQEGGFLLIADYGHTGEKEDTFRAFRNHQLHNPLIDPGMADLTADVDFNFLRNVAAGKLLSLGPVSQKDFLSELHIDTRLQVLISNSPSEEMKKTLRSGYNMIMDPNEMGGKFKFIAMFPKVLDDFIKLFPPAGFRYPV